MTMKKPTLDNKHRVRSDSINMFGVERWDDKHLTYLSTIVHKMFSISDDIVENIKELDKDKKLSENDKRFIIFSIGVNIGEELGKEQKNNNVHAHYR